jgi:hypothetical protein
MAHWAQINKNNIVVNVTVGNNDDPNGDEGYQWLIDHLGGTWIKTSYNTYGGVHKLGGTPLRKNYAGIGFHYDPENDCFYGRQPYPSWILNKETYLWEPPVEMPKDRFYTWDEATVSWI